MCAYLAKHGQAQVLSVDYRLAPNTFSPRFGRHAGVVEALLAQGVDPRNVVFGGDSAGGGLTLATLVAIRDKGLPQPAGAFLFSLTDLSCSGETMRTQARADAMFEPPGSAPRRPRFMGGSARQHTAGVPLVLPTSAGLPPLMFHASEHEILLDDSRPTPCQGTATGRAKRTAPS